MLLKIAGTVNDSIVDGPGIRLTVFTQGCPHKCVGCHNPQTHDINGGYSVTTEELALMAEENPLLQGLTFSGGEPFLQCEALCDLADRVIPKGLDIIAYTGYTWEELIKKPQAVELIKRCKYLIDGPFILEQKSLMLKFRGSANQRIIDVQESLKQGRPVIADI